MSSDFHSFTSGLQRAGIMRNMTIPSRESRVFFGWWTVLVTGMISGLGLGFYFYGISALFKPIALELGFSRAVTSGAIGLGTMVGTLFAPLVGWIVDKFGPRMTTLTGVVITVAGLVCMYFIQSSLGFYLAWGLVLGSGVNLGLTIAIDKALTNWFVKKIGLAIGTKFALIGLTGALILPLVSWLISAFGWRNTCLIWAAVMTCGIPFILIFVRSGRPEFYGMLPDGEKALSSRTRDEETIAERPFSHAAEYRRSEFTLAEAMRTHAFWILAFCAASNFFIITSFNTHCIPFLLEKDFDLVAGGRMMGIMLLFTIPSRFMGGVFADRVAGDRMNLLLGLPFLLHALGFGIILIDEAFFTIHLLLVLYGLAHGLPIPLFIILISRYFGRKAFGAIFGTLLLFGSPVALSAPIIVGWIFDATGSYRPAFLSFAGVALFTTLVLVFLKPPSKAVQS
jgi:cyanate permease